MKRWFAELQLTSSLGLVTQSLRDRRSQIVEWEQGGALGLACALPLIFFGSVATRQYYDRVYRNIILTAGAVEWLQAAAPKRATWTTRIQRYDGFPR